MQVESGLSPPPEAYLFFPSPKEQKSKPGKDGRRFYFFGSNTQKPQQPSAEVWRQGESLLRREPEAADSAVGRVQGRERSPNDGRVRKVEGRVSADRAERQDRVLSGVIYLMGRCHRYRPIYVLNVSELFKEENIQDIKRAVCFFFEKIIAEMMLPGQVQNWICVVNVNNLGVTQLPIKAGGAVTSFMQSNYRGRLYKMYVVNAPFAVSLAYNGIKVLLDQATKQKITVTSGNKLDKIEELANLSQVEEKFGGKLPNVKEYFPIRLPSPDSQSKDMPLIGKEEYRRLFKEGRLTKNKVCELLIE